MATGERYEYEVQGGMVSLTSVTDRPLSIRFKLPSKDVEVRHARQFLDLQFSCLYQSLDLLRAALDDNGLTPSTPE